MKKILAMLLCMLMLVSVFAACGAKDTTDGTADTTAADTTVADTTVADTEEAADTAEATEPAAVMSYEEFAAAAIDTEVTVETYIQAKQGWWTNDQGVGVATFYTQNEEGAYFLYDMPCSEDDYNNVLVEGAKIRVTGYKAEWSGEVEIMEATYEVLEGNYIAMPLDITEKLGTDELINYMNQKCSFNGLTVAPSTDADGNEVAYLYKWDGSGTKGDDLYFNVSYNGNTYNFTVESYLCGQDTDVYKAVEGLKVGDKVNLEGFLYWYEGANPHVTGITVVE